jgi:hypothetical protein
MCTLPNAAIQCCCGQHRAAVLGPAVPAETVPTQRNPHLQCIADHECMGCRKAPGYTNMPLSGGRSLNTALCRADGSFDRRIKTKFGPDVGKFLRVHVAPVQGEKAESREASFAEMDLWHASADPNLDQATFNHCPDRRWHLWLSG